MASVAMQKAAQDLVERSRCGDQNATAMIIEIRRAALKGSEKAQIGYELLKKIVQASPVKPTKDGGEPVMGEEAYGALHYLAHRGPILALAALVALPDMGGEQGISAAAVVLANGPRVLSKRFVSEIGQGIEEEVYRHCFFYGVNYCGRKGRKVARQVRGHGDAASFIHAGRCVGLARAIQRVRHPQSWISDFNRLAGWELGEALVREAVRMAGEDDELSDDYEDEDDGGYYEDDGGGYADDGGGGGGGGGSSEPSGGGGGSSPAPSGGGGSPAPSGGGGSPAPSGGGASPAPSGGGASPEDAPKKRERFKARMRLPSPEAAPAPAPEVAPEAPAPRHMARHLSMLPREESAPSEEHHAPRRAPPKPKPRPRKPPPPPRRGGRGGRRH